VHLRMVTNSRRKARCFLHSRREAELKIHSLSPPRKKNPFGASRRSPHEATGGNELRGNAGGDELGGAVSTSALLACRRHSTALPPPRCRTSTCAATRLHRLRAVVLLSPHGESVPPEAGSPSPTSSVQRSRNSAAVAPGRRGPPRRRPPTRSVLPRECGPDAVRPPRLPA
jgi:hypothetical protein